MTCFDEDKLELHLINLDINTGLFFEEKFFYYTRIINNRRRTLKEKKYGCFIYSGWLITFVIVAILILLVKGYVNAKPSRSRGRTGLRKQRHLRGKAGFMIPLSNNALILILSNSRQMFGRQKQSQHWTSLTSVPMRHIKLKWYNRWNDCGLQKKLLELEYDRYFQFCPRCLGRKLAGSGQSDGAPLRWSMTVKFASKCRTT